MVRERAVLVLLLAIGCGARTGLTVLDEEPSPTGDGGDGDDGGGAPTVGRGGVNGSGRGGVSNGGKSGARGGGGGRGGVGGGGRGGASNGGRGGVGGGGRGGFGGGGRGGVAGGGEGGVDAAGFGGEGGVPLSTECELVGDDPRVAGIKLDEVSSLDANDFVRGDVRSYHWSVQTEDCDAVVQNAQFKLDGADSQVVKFQPSRPAFYHFTLDVTGVGGDHASCKLEVPVEGVGMRVELCWDTSTTTDLDLYLHTPFDREPWFVPGSTDIFNGLDDTTCNTSNCSAALRGFARVDWGYPESAPSTCSTPSFEGFNAIGHCPNPRAADDNNQDLANGTTERVQLDNPGDGETFRVMAQNFDNEPAQPHVFVYCGGERAGAFEPPDMPPNFVAAQPGGFGVMWRATDITTHLDANGHLSCSAAPVSTGALTIDDPTF
ncbi:MAG: hypothetical protein ABUL60_08545 [Myxococcales bacterium]